MATNEFRITSISISSSRKNIEDMASFYSGLLDIDFKYNYPFDWHTYAFKLPNLSIHIVESGMRGVEAKNNRIMLTIEMSDIHTRVENALKIGGEYARNYEKGIKEDPDFYSVGIIDPDGNQINLREKRWE